MSKNRLQKYILSVTLSAFLWSAAGVLPAMAEAPVVLPGQTYPGVLYSSQLLDNISFSDTLGHWARGAIIRTAAQSIVRGYGNRLFRPGESLTREEALALLIRLMGLESQAQQATLTSNPAEKIKPRWSDGYIAVALEKGLVTAEEREKLLSDRAKPAQRQEVAAWTGRALGLAPLYGPRQQAIYNFKDWQQVAPAYLPLLEAVLQEGVMVGTSPTTFAPRDLVKRGEMATLLDRLSPRFLSPRGLQVLRGEVSAREEGASVVNSTVIRWVDFQVQTAGGQVIRMRAETGSSQGDRDFFVFKEDRLGRSPLLATGDLAQVILNQDGVLYVEVTGKALEEPAGTLVAVNDAGKEVTISTSGGGTASYPVSPYVAVTVDRRDARLTDLLKGQEVSLVVKNGVVTAIRATLGDDLPGYTPVATRVINGRIAEIRTGEITVAVDGGSEEALRITGGTVFFQDGAPATLQDLKVGAPVRLTVSGERDITRLDLAGPNDNITAILKGRVEKVNPTGNQLVLGQVSSYYYGDWLPLADVKAVEVDPAAPVYAGGRPLELAGGYPQLVGQEVYAAIASPYGKEVAVKITAKSGEGLSLNSPVKTLPLGGQELRLEGEQSFLRFNAGTIVVKDRKLAQPADLSGDDHLFVVANRDAGFHRAAVIISQEFYPARWQSYRGVIDRVREDDFRLERYSEFDPTGWEEPGGSSDYMNFILSWEAVVVDATGQSGKTITPEEFYRSRFTDKYEDEYVYLVSRQGRVEAMVIYPYSQRYNATKTSLGRVKSVDSAGGQLVLEAVRDYSEGYQKWIANPDPMYLQGASAIVIKNNRVTSLSQLAQGDAVYLVHDQVKGVLLFVQ
ncbi:hypothetical protein SY88_04285 [Clostridiales bacterium PH28_bin88]|nr:hypothetical protein SY88_04285 [Clostridiales bacterium PH28_bin88]